MNLMRMRFREFTWPVNPTELTVEGERNVRETPLPYAGSRIDDLGEKKRKVTGQGYFTGPGCFDCWNELRKAFSKGGPGFLQLPGQEPFFAVMDSLKLIGTPGRELLRYGFSFTEYWGKAKNSGGVYRAEEGESLWDYAWRYNRGIHQMAEANPQIRDIACLKAGEEVRVP